MSRRWRPSSSACCAVAPFAAHSEPAGAIFAVQRHSQRGDVEDAVVLVSELEPHLAGRQIGVLARLSHEKTRCGSVGGRGATSARGRRRRGSPRPVRPDESPRELAAIEIDLEGRSRVAPCAARGKGCRLATFGGSWSHSVPRTRWDLDDARAAVRVAEVCGEGRRAVLDHTLQQRPYGLAHAGRVGRRLRPGAFPTRGQRRGGRQERGRGTCEEKTRSAGKGHSRVSRAHGCSPML